MDSEFLQGQQFVAFKNLDGNYLAISDTKLQLFDKEFKQLLINEEADN